MPKDRKKQDDDEEDDSKIFPQRLMEILADEKNHEAISWLPHGRAFMIRKRDLFAETVMPRYFSRKAKYSSFTRKLNRWNFVRVSSGPELGAYYHEFFLRDKPHLAAQMFCKNARTMLAMASSESAPTDRKVTAAGSNTSQMPQMQQPRPHLQQRQPAQSQPHQQLPDIRGLSMEPTRGGMQLPPVTPALLAALTKEPAHGSNKSMQALAGYTPTNIKLLELHIMQQEQANRILFEHAMALSVQQRQEQQAKLAAEQSRLAQMRHLMNVRRQQQQQQHMAPPHERASAA